MSDILIVEQAAQFLYAEARSLDERRWDDWLDLFAEDAVYWVPAWRNEHEPTTDPDAEISLIYYNSRAGLLDRVWRLRSGLSVASKPLRRTAHIISNVAIVGEDEDGSVTVQSNCAAHLFDPKRRTQHVFFSLYEHKLKRADAGWKIARKKIVLLNDFIPAVADVYLL